MGTKSALSAHHVLPPHRRGLTEEVVEYVRAYLDVPNDPETVAAIPGLIAALRTDPECEASRMALADALTDVDTSPVRYGHFPRWLTTAHGRTRPREWHDAGYGSAADKAKQSIRDCGGRRVNSENPMDHCGSSVLAGVSCYVAEPYMEPDAILEGVRPMAIAMGCAFVALDRGYWNPHVGRGVIFEPLVMPPPRKPERRTA